MDGRAEHRALGRAHHGAEYAELVAGILRYWTATALAVVIVGISACLILVSLNYPVARRADLRLATERRRRRSQDE